MFFIINGCFQLVPAIRTTSPLASFIPVTFIIVVGMVFEGIAESRRSESDARFNEQKIKKVNLPSKEIAEINAEDLQVGHVIKLENNE